MSVVFLDTVGLIALWNSSDQWHAAAESAYREMVRKRLQFVTTQQIFLECGNLAARTSFRDKVNALRLSMRSRNEIASPTTAEWETAWRAFDQYEAAGAGIVDQISFQVMRRLGITEAFTNDHHFRAAGFVTLF